MPDSQLTKRALAAAMKSLMAEESLAKISIGDIVARCEMNRKSFYYHFKDKYDLVNWIYYTEFVSALRAQPLTDIWALLAHICDFLDQHRVFYCNALRVTGQNGFPEYFCGILRTLLTADLQQVFESDAEKAFYVDFMAHALCHAISTWLLAGAAPSSQAFVEQLRCGTFQYARWLLRT